MNHDVLERDFSDRLIEDFGTYAASIEGKKFKSLAHMLQALKEIFLVPMLHVTEFSLIY